MPTVILLAFPLFFDSDTVFAKHLYFRTLSSHGFPTLLLHRNASVLYSLVQMPLLPGSPIPLSPCILAVGQKKIGLLFGLLPRILWNTFSHKTEGHSCLSEGLSSPAHPLPYFPGKIGIDHSVGEGWARLLF